MSEKIQRAASRQAQLSRRGKQKNKSKKNRQIQPHSFQNMTQPPDPEPRAMEDIVFSSAPEPPIQTTPRPPIYAFIGSEVRRFAIIGGIVLVILTGISFFL